ncbi:MAG: DNA-processing protein DprA [Gammaproteobacteria bacterium]
MPAANAADYYLLVLMLTKGIGAKLMRRLLDAFDDDARAAAKAPEAELCKLLPKKVAARVCRKEGEAAVEAAMKWSEQSDEHKLLVVGGDEYPQRLTHCSDAPLVLYASGQNPRILNADIIAIVGSRSASPAGVHNAEVFARTLSLSNIAVASGMAQGIDAAAHQGAIDGGAGTIAVVGTGPDIVYPREHRKLAMRIRETGMIIGELPPGTPPDKFNFPPRNRIISGIARGCLVIEAGEKSGALITARHAMDNSREVFAVPGSINSPMHRGCHKLIKEGAKLTETINDIAEELSAENKINGDGINGAANAGDANANANGDGGVFDDILPHIDYEPTAADDIAGRSGMTAAALMPALLELEMQGKIAAAAGGKYQRLPG